MGKPCYMACKTVGVAISSGSVMMENWNHWLPWGSNAVDWQHQSCLPMTAKELTASLLTATRL